MNNSNWFGMYVDNLIIDYHNINCLHYDDLFDVSKDDLVLVPHLIQEIFGDDLIINPLNLNK